MRTGIALLLLLLLSAPALAGETGHLTDETITERIRVLRPAIEKVLGEKLPETIDASVAKRKEVEESILRIVRKRLANIEGGPRGDALEANCRQIAKIMGSAVFGYVDLENGRMMICPANFETVAKAVPSWDGILAPEFLDVILVHELVHVYQWASRNAGPASLKPTTMDGLTAFQCLCEGHAQFVTRKVAAELGLNEPFQLLVKATSEVPDSITDETMRYTLGIAQAEFSLAYVGGERFFEAVVKRIGYAKAVEDLFNKPPTVTTAISNPDEYFAPREETFDLERAGKLVQRLLAERHEGVVRAPAARGLLTAALAPVGPEVAEQAMSGFRQAVAVRTPDNLRMVVICLFDSAEGAARFESANKLLIKRKAEMFGKEGSMFRIVTADQSTAEFDGTTVYLLENLIHVASTNQKMQVHSARFVYGRLTAELIITNGTGGQDEIFRFARRTREFLRSLLEGSPWSGMPREAAQRTILESVDDDYWGVRWRAVRNLGRFKSLRDRAQEAVLRKVSDREPNVRLAAFESLGALDGPDFTLHTALMDPDWEIRDRCLARAADDESPEVEDSIACLLAAAADPHPAPRTTALKGLVKLDGQDRLGWEVLLASLKHPSVFVREAAYEAFTLARVPWYWNRKKQLENLPPAEEVAAVLVEAMRDGDSDVRHRAAELLDDAPVDLPGVAEAIVAGLSDRSSLVRMSSVYAIKDFGPSAASAVDRLIELLEDKHLADVAAEALGNIGQAAERAEPQLRTLLKHPEEENRLAAAVALTKLGADGAEFVDLYRDVIRGQSKYDRDDAAEALGVLGPKAAAAVPDLIEMLQDTDTRLQRKAAEALGKIGAAAKEAIPALQKIAEGDEEWNAKVARKAIELIQAAAWDEK